MFRQLYRLAARLLILPLAFATGQAAPLAASDRCSAQSLSNGQPAGPYRDSQLDIAPYLPSSADTIEITASGEWSNSCVPKYQSHTLDGNVIRIDAEAFWPGACAEVLTSWSFAVEAGP